MKILYIECNMGAAGDMLTAALLELLEDKSTFLQQMNTLLDRVTVIAEKSTKCGIVGTHVSVKIDGEEEQSTDVNTTEINHNTKHNHEHTHIHHNHIKNHNNTITHQHHHTHKGLNDINELLKTLAIPQKAKDDALAVYQLIAKAEARVHGRTVTQVHFHEVGNLDAVTDIVGVCILMSQLAPDEVIVSPINVGSGFVHCSHGILPVPAPATAHILQEVPTYSSSIKGELCTPTGAALLKHFAASFGAMPQISVKKIGYGLGKKDFEAANCVRAFIGEAEKTSAANGEIAELRCNIDDMTGESIGYACKVLFEAGAKDVFVTPVQMKKNRPATLLTCICNVEKADEFAALILKHTTTFGVRKTICSRYMLNREITKKETPYGTVRIKTGSGYGVKKSKPEYDDISAAAEKSGVTIEQVRSTL